MVQYAYMTGKLTLLKYLEFQMKENMLVRLVS